jgi:DNA-binding GntR family transcriptional regulator
MRAQAVADTSDTASPARARQNQGSTADRAEDLIQRQAMIARIACGRMKTPTLNAVRGTIEHARRLPAKPGWAHKAAAHAEVYRLLADIAGDAGAGERGSRAGLICELMRTVGPAADQIIISSHRRLLAHLSAGDGDGASLEMETHLRVLHFMWRLAAVTPQAGDAR